VRTNSLFNRAVKGSENGHSGGNSLNRSRRFDFALTALSRTPISLFYQTRDLVYQWAENLPDGIGSDDVIGRLDGDFLPAAVAQRLVAAKVAAMETGETQRFEIPISRQGQVRWFDTWVDADTDEQGQVAGVFSTLIEITAQKRREVQLRNLLREVSHRSKNLLAIVLSLATQTARHSTSVSGFIADFSGRLQAIARAQDLVTDRDWLGASLHDLIVKEVALFRGERPLDLQLSGIDRVISPTAALYVGLAIHELAAYAARTGSWRTEPISISIAQPQNHPDENAIAFEWTARGAAPGVAFDGLPKIFLETVVPLSVDGVGTIADGGGNLTYRLTIGSAHIG
jgi:two-component sensor histidine kinase